VDFGRVAYGAATTSFTISQVRPYEVATLVITPGGTAGEPAFIKLDAMLRDANSRSEAITFFLTRDGTNQRSLEQAMAVPPLYGTSGSVTWVVEGTAGLQETFRLQVFAQPFNSICAQQNTCTLHQVTAAISAITAPFGASGGRTLY
jgi:hypothetical protein